MRKTRNILLRVQKDKPEKWAGQKLARGYLASHDKLCQRSSISRAPPTTK